MADQKVEPITVTVQDVQTSKQSSARPESEDVKPAPSSSSGLMTIRKELLDAVVVHQAQRISELERMVEKKRAKIEQLATSQPFLHPSQPFVIPPTNPAAAAVAAAAAQNTLQSPTAAGNAQPETGTVGTMPQPTPTPPPIPPHNPMISPNPLLPPNPMVSPNPVMAAAMAAVAAAGHPQVSGPTHPPHPFVYTPSDHPAFAAGLMGMVPPQVPVPRPQPVQRPASSQPAQSSDGNDRKQSRYWTEDEHQRYLAAVNTCGPRNYEQISEIVGTRNAKQVRTHAQKFQKKLEREEAKRRNSMRLSGVPPPATSVGAAAAAAVAAAAAAAIHGNVPCSAAGALTANHVRQTPGPTSSSSGKNFVQGDQPETGRASPSVEGSSSANDVSGQRHQTHDANTNSDVGSSSAAAAAAAAVAAEAAALGGSVLQREGLSAVVANRPVAKGRSPQRNNESSINATAIGRQRSGKQSSSSKASVDGDEKIPSSKSAQVRRSEVTSSTKPSAQRQGSERDNNSGEEFAQVTGQSNQMSKNPNGTEQRALRKAVNGSSVSSKAEKSPEQNAPRTKAKCLRGNTLSNDSKAPVDSKPTKPSTLPATPSTAVRTNLSRTAASPAPGPSCAQTFSLGTRPKSTGQQMSMQQSKSLALSKPIAKTNTALVSKAIRQTSETSKSQVASAETPSVGRPPNAAPSQMTAIKETKSAPSTPLDGKSAISGPSRLLKAGGIQQNTTSSNVLSKGNLSECPGQATASAMAKSPGTSGRTQQVAKRIPPNQSRPVLRAEKGKTDTGVRSAAGMKPNVITDQAPALSVSKNDNSSSTQQVPSTVVPNANSNKNQLKTTVVTVTGVSKAEGRTGTSCRSQKSNLQSVSTRSFKTMVNPKSVKIGEKVIDLTSAEPNNGKNPSQSTAKAGRSQPATADLDPQKKSGNVSKHTVASGTANLVNSGHVESKQDVVQHSNVPKEQSSSKYCDDEESKGRMVTAALESGPSASTGQGNFENRLPPRQGGDKGGNTTCSTQAQLKNVTMNDPPRDATKAPTSPSGKRKREGASTEADKKRPKQSCEGRQQNEGGKDPAEC